MFQNCIPLLFRQWDVRTLWIWHLSNSCSKQSWHEDIYTLTSSFGNLQCQVELVFATYLLWSDNYSSSISVSVTVVSRSGETYKFWRILLKSNKAKAPGLNEIMLNNSKTNVLIVSNIQWVKLNTVNQEIRTLLVLSALAGFRYFIVLSFGFLAIICQWQ